MVGREEKKLMRRTRIAGALLVTGSTIVALSCGDPSPVGVDSRSLRHGDLIGWLVQHTTGLARCWPIPYDSVTQTIGPTGGVLLVGPHTLSVPAGALLQPVTVTAVAPSDTVNRVRFQPEGLQFQQPATLTLSYANCFIQPPPAPGIAYISDALEILEFLQSLTDSSSQTVTAQLRHFSGYAVDW
jgi:hypothetical protein